MTNNAKFWDKIAEKYFRQPIADQDAYNIKLETTREYLKPDMSVLEFGCGTGGTAIKHAPYVANIDCVDISGEMLRIAEEQARAAGVSNLRFIRSDIDAFEAPAETYDAILGMSILHLVDDRRATIARIRNMLKPGGVFVSSTACLGDTMPIFKWLGPVGAGLGLIPTVRVFKASELSETIENAGFKIVHQWRPEKAHAAFIIAMKAG